MKNMLVYNQLIKFVKKKYLNRVLYVKNVGMCK